MSGHTHAQNIRRKKEAIDKKRGKIFSQLAKKLIAAARAGGGDPNANLALKYAIDKAKAANMPNDTIERAIKKGTGELDGAAQLVEQTFEGVGPGGVHIFVECLTDNRNRTAPEIRKIFEIGGGKLGGPGSTAWLFEKKGVIALEAAQIDEDELLELVLEAGADDMTAEDDLYEITCSPQAFEEVRTAVEGRGLTTTVAEVMLVPKSRVRIEDQKTARRVLKLLEALEEHDDVNQVASNEDIVCEIALEG
ncbi:MAG: YebC/PmpR family DNA-binding transcriptional regulator [Planctomycetota bacterium]|nr:MAG: YebC/PmpR family DNA-binding transcriptional regulator [Planctomycetota bacterium]